MSIVCGVLLGDYNSYFGTKVVLVPHLVKTFHNHFADDKTKRSNIHSSMAAMHALKVSYVLRANLQDSIHCPVSTFKL